MNNNYPNPRIGIVFPASAVVLVALFALAVYLFAGARSSRHAGAVLADSGRARVHDSIAVALALSRVSLAEFGRQVEQARGDSLAALLAARAAVVRTRWLPGRVDTLRDTLLVAGADVRAVVYSDSACRVSLDSLRGELVQARWDADQCAERPTTCSGWSAFGLGFGLGTAAGMASCVVLR